MTQVSERFQRLLESCLVEVRVIRACDKTLGIRTPIPAKPKSETAAVQVLMDLKYLAWELEGRRNARLRAVA